MYKSTLEELENDKTGKYAGKGFHLRMKEILLHRLLKGEKIIIIDPKDEYKELVKALNQ